MFRLKEVSDKISCHGFLSPPALHAIRGHAIQQVAIGPNHIALLLQVIHLKYYTATLVLISTPLNLCYKHDDSVLITF